jgi:hypothetical protein
MPEQDQEAVLRFYRNLLARLDAALSRNGGNRR